MKGRRGQHDREKPDDEGRHDDRAEDVGARKPDQRHAGQQKRRDRIEAGHLQRIPAEHRRVADRRRKHEFEQGHQSADQKQGKKDA